MSSRSNGVTNVRLIRSTRSCVRRSPACSSSLMSRLRFSAPCGNSSSRSIKRWEISTAFAAALLYRSKNSRLWGTRLSRATGGCLPLRHDRSAGQGRSTVRPRRYLSLQMRLDIPVFQAYQGTEPPRFASQAELECAKVLDYYGISWPYEPTPFLLDVRVQGRNRCALVARLFVSEQAAYMRLQCVEQQ